MMGKLIFGLLFGAAIGTIFGLMLGPTLVSSRSHGALPRTERNEEELPNGLKGLWRDIKSRLDEAIAAGKDAARETEEELRRKYQESIHSSQQRRR